MSPSGAAPPLGRYLGSRDGVLHRLPTGPGSLLRTSLLGTRSKVHLAGVLARLPRMVPAKLEGTSTREWLDALELRPDADAVIRALLRLGTYCADVDDLGADAGTGPAAAGRSRRCPLPRRRLGPTDHCTVRRHRGPHLPPARHVTPAAGGLEVAVSDDRVIARQVVVAVGPPAAARALLPDPPDWGDLGAPVTAACLDLGVRRPPRPGLRPRDRRAAVRHHPGPAGPPGAGEGRAVVAVLRYGARSAAEDRPALDAHRRLAGVADDDVVAERFLASMTVAGTAAPGRARRAARPAGVGVTGHPRRPPRRGLGGPGGTPGRRRPGQRGGGRPAGARPGSPGRPRPVSDGRAGRPRSSTAERPRLVGLAYRILGSLADAEDVVSEAWFRWERGRPVDASTGPRPGSPPSPPGSPSTTCGPGDGPPATRDHGCPSRSWPRPGPEEAAELADSLTLGFLILLDELGPG